MYGWPVRRVNEQRLLSGSWQRLYDLARANPGLKIVMILNPDNGDFGLGNGLLTQDQMDTVQANPDIMWAEQQMKSAGVVVAGYIYTNYGARNVAVTEQRIDLYKKLYDASGMMFDQMSNQAGSEQYYRALSAHSKTAAGMEFTIGNPGTVIAESYVGSVDTLIIYEDRGLPSISTLKARTFNGRYDKNNFGAIPFCVPSYDRSWVLQARPMVGHIYVTSACLPNPWDALSPFASLLARDLQQSL
jgi:hypothetical protein